VEVSGKQEGSMDQKVLVVDDEPDLLRMIEIRLKANQYRVFCACDGKTGLEIAGREHPDLILLDIMMPVMNGIETLRALKQTSETSSIPVIMLSQKKETHSILEAKGLGASDYILKPFSTKDLMRSIEKHIL
jgi:two-component system alkaline phosphatase synthesis response regulator PhoP